MSPTSLAIGVNLDLEASVIEVLTEFGLKASDRTEVENSLTLQTEVDLEIEEFPDKFDVTQVEQLEARLRGLGLRESDFAFFWD